jgi:hypothetical protein
LRCQPGLRRTFGKPSGSTGYENAVNEKGERLIWLERRMLDKLESYRRPGESYSDVILRLAGGRLRLCIRNSGSGIF